MLSELRKKDGNYFQSNDNKIGRQSSQDAAASIPTDCLIFIYTNAWLVRGCIAIDKVVRNNRKMLQLQYTHMTSEMSLLSYSLLNIFT